MPPQYDLAATIPCTIMVALQLWVLSNFTIFDVTPRNVYAEVLASTSDWIAVLDENGKIIYANNAILNKSAYTIYDVTGMQIDQLIAVKASESEKKYNWDSIKKIKHKNFSELLLRFKNAGEWYNVQSYVKKTLLPNRSIAFVWVFIDTSRIESLKLSKEIIATKNIELRKAYDDTVFLMNMTSHDLKTPLKTIMELAEMVKKENKQIGANRSLEYLDYIMSISNESLTFAQQMIEYMRVGVANKKREWCNMDRILIEVKQRLFTQLERSSALIVYKGLDTIFCDARHIKELLTNLIDNAIKYQVNEKPIIEILVSDQGPTYEFLIKDNGIGIHQDFLPHLFSEYSREEKMMTAGSGMGLYLCKKIIEANQGQITAFNNKPNKGITILFTMVKLES
ncbi:MAG: PAS domain-containing protein [Ferruginibacter sp.]|nr:PAS domain-containing protein [Ferruginibacter sp.]